MKNIKKNAQGYGYKYTDLAEIHNYLESVNCSYIQRTTTQDGVDYIETLRCIDGEWEKDWLRGSRVIQATLTGKNNPAQEQGSGLTYARRYSLLMAFGLATTDDDGQLLTKDTINEASIKALKQIISNKNLSNEYVLSILDNHNYKKLADIKYEDLMTIQKELSE